MYFMTGVAGFIGSNIAAAFEAWDKPLIIADTLSCADKWRNIARLPLEDGVGMYVKDYLEKGN